MIAQLDPGFTTEGFLANFGIAALGSFVGTIGAFVVAWVIYRRTSKDERDRFEQTLANERQVFQDTIAHDLKLRREEDEARQKERAEAAREAYKQMLVSLLGEIIYNLRVVEESEQKAYIKFPLRVLGFEHAYPAFGMLPSGVGEAVQFALFRIDLYNAIDPGDSGQHRALLDLKEPLNEAASLLATHIRAQGFMTEEHTTVPGPPSRPWS